MNWNVGKITDYFDNRNQNNIWEYSQEYAKLSMEEKPKVDALLRDNIQGYLDYIESMRQPDLLRMIAGTIVDDIYRSANLLYYYSDDVADYLRATSAVIMNWYSKRGIQIHYMSNNTYSDMQRPLIVFPMMFKRSGLLFICPQHIAWQEMEKRDILIEHFCLYFKDFEKSSRDEASDLIQRCCESGVHYIHLDIDGGLPSFEKEIRDCRGKKGHYLFFKEEAPQDSGKYVDLS